MLLLGIVKHLCSRLFDFRKVGLFFAGKDGVPPDVFDQTAAFAHFDLHQPEHFAVERVGLIRVNTSQQNVDVKDLFRCTAALQGFRRLIRHIADFPCGL